MSERAKRTERSQEEGDRQRFLNTLHFRAPWSVSQRAQSAAMVQRLQSAGTEVMEPGSAGEWFFLGSPGRSFSACPRVGKLPWGAF